MKQDKITPRHKGIKCMKEKPSVKLYWEELSLIANYYEFPSIVFLMDPKDLKERMKGKTRSKELKLKGDPRG